MTDCESFHIIDLVVPGPTSAEYDPRGFPSPETVAQRKTSCSPSLSFQMKALPEYKGQERAFSQVRPVRPVRPVRRVRGTCIRVIFFLVHEENKDDERKRVPGPVVPDVSVVPATVRCDMFSRTFTRPQSKPMTGAGNNTWLIDGAEPSLIDAGVGHAAHVDAIAAALGGRDLARVLVTHHHADHSSGIDALRARWPSLDARKWVQAGEHGWRGLSDNERVRAGDRDLIVIHTPGHAPDHVCFWDPAESRALFRRHAGDRDDGHDSGRARRQSSPVPRVARAPGGARSANRVSRPRPGDRSADRSDPPVHRASRDARVTDSRGAARRGDATWTRS